MRLLFDPIFTNCFPLHHHLNYVHTYMKIMILFNRFHLLSINTVQQFSEKFLQTEVTMWRSLYSPTPNLKRNFIENFRFIAFQSYICATDIYEYF